MVWLEGEGGGGGGQKVPIDHNSKSISDEMKFGAVVENYRLINLVLFNCLMMPLLHHNEVINTKIFSLLVLLNCFSFIFNVFKCELSKKSLTKCKIHSRHLGFQEMVLCNTYDNTNHM